MQYIVIKDFEGSENGVDVQAYYEGKVIDVQNVSFAELIEKNKLAKKYNANKTNKKTKEAAK